MIWVIGGTKDARTFLEKFPISLKNVVVTTATEYGGKLLESLGIKVYCKKLTQSMMVEFIENENIDIVVDFSHPYATEVSMNAIKVSCEKNIKYLRFEREEINTFHEKSKEFETISSLVKYIETLDEHILVTLGSNNISTFSSLKNLEKCYFRILPKWEMLKKCEDFGILPKNILALQGPFSKEMNKIMIKEYNIKYLVTKQAGDVGGEREKLEAAKEMGIEVVLLTRPKIDYPNCYQDMDKLINEIKNCKY